MLFGTLFYHGKLKGKCNCSCKKINSCVYTRVEAGEATPSQPNQLQRHHCPSFLAAGIVSGSTELLVSSLSLSALGVTWPTDVTTPTHCADRRTVACVRAVRPNPPNPPSLRACDCSTRVLYICSSPYHVQEGGSLTYVSRPFPKRSGNETIALRALSA